MDEEDFPVITFILATVMLAVFLFTYTNINYYENLLGFIPSQPKIYALITYAFVHSDVLHLFFNLVFLFAVGIAVEKELGKFVYFSVFIASANIAIIFDILGRFISGISFAAPFIGSSGGIFGLLAVASLIKPTPKLPMVLNLLILIAIVANLSPYVQLMISRNVFDSDVLLFLGGFAVIFTLAFLILLPSFPPIYSILLIFLIDWMLLVVLKLAPNVSNVGHLGGVIGGIIAFFIFAEKRPKT